MSSDGISRPEADNRRDVTFIDVSGLGSSGKSAVTDLLREFDGVYAPHFQFEFDFLRAPGGLLDLRHALVEDWSPVRSHAALRRFSRLVQTLGGDPRPWDLLGLVGSGSQRYSRHFGPNFFAVWEAFAESFVALRYRAEWPFDDYEINGLWRLLKRLLKRAGLRARFLHNVTVLDGVGFDLKARRALNDLYAPLLTPDQRFVILNNAFEPYHPAPALDMLASARQIVVVRDPRDIFTSGQKATKTGAAAGLQAFDNDGLNKTFLATDDVAAFCRRQRIHFDTMQRLTADNEPRVLLLWFEDLVLSPEAAKARICAFLGLDPRAHARPATSFKPEQSRKSIGVAKSFADQAAIAYIARELEDMLYPDW